MDTFKKLFKYGEEKKYCMVIALLLSALSTILSFLPYYYFWQMLIEITGNADYSVIKGIALSIFISTLLFTVTYVFSLIFSHIFAFRIETNMRKAGIVNLLDASFSFFDISPSGKTRKIIDDNASNTHTIVAHMLPDAVNCILFPICLLVLSFMADYRIGILVVVSIILSVLCFKGMYSGTNANMMQEYMSALEDINSETVEYVRGIQVIKIFDTVVESFKKLYNSILHYSKVVNRQSQLCKVPYSLFQTLMATFGALVIVVAYSDLESKTAAQIISLVVFFMSFSGLLFAAFMKIMFFSQNYTLGKEAVDNLEKIFGQMNKNKLKQGDISEMKSYDIDFEDVSFAYEEGNNIISKLNLSLEGGKKYALVGSSGGGKSTIAKLISGFYPVTDGRLKIGGIPIENYSKDVLEKNIAFVFQNSKLFKTSIYENVSMGNPKASHNQVMKALELAMCNEILDKFENREETIIGSKGVYLSGGEIQRIAIARAILKDAPIVILDEASAASDPENEYEIQRAFSQLMIGKTVIMIAHRLSSIKNVDEILVVEDGQIIERGSHQILMEQRGKYRSFQDLFGKANEWRLNYED